jgi:hypothetical protein
MKGKKPHKAAAQEAEEEAGVKGDIKDEPLGYYDYWKRRAAHFDLCRVDVYPLEVSKQLKSGGRRGSVSRGGSRSKSGPPGAGAGACRTHPQPAGAYLSPSSRGRPPDFCGLQGTEPPFKKSFL